MDNAAEFSSKTFQEFCEATGIDIEYSVPHVHTQNGLAESFIKRLQWIARPLLMQSKLPATAWGHAILHAAALVRLRPTAHNDLSPLQLTSGTQPCLSHLRKFGCAVYVPIPPPVRTKMGPQRRLGIYVGYVSPSIIRYIEPLTGDLFTARFADCHFDELVFPSLGGGKKDLMERRELTWYATTLAHLDPRSQESENEVKRILHLQNIANQLPDAFNDASKVTRSVIPAINVPARLDVPKDTGNNKMHNDNDSLPRRKRGRPTGSKDLVPRKVRVSSRPRTQSELCPEAPINPDREEISHDLTTALCETLAGDTSQRSQFLTPGEFSAERNEIVPVQNYENQVFYNETETCDRRELIIDDIFVYKVATQIHAGNDDDIDEPRSINECRQRDDWPHWKAAIQVELESLNKRGVFGSIEPTPKGVHPVGSKWVFVRKRNESNEVVRYKARLVAQGFSQKPGIDYDETYSPVMDAITFRYLLSLAVSEKLEMRLMDVVTAYLYGHLDSDIYMKVPEGLNKHAYTALKGAGVERPEMRSHSIKLRRSLYGLKQSGRMWYSRLTEYLSQEGYKNNPICPCVFIKQSPEGFAILAVYVDDINLIGTARELEKASEYLKREFEMKDLGETKLCLGLQIEKCADGILVHQKKYTENMLKKFNLDKSHPLSTPMVVRSLQVSKDPFRPRGKNEEVLGPETPYLSAIGALLYLANCTRPDIAFAVNVLARYSCEPTLRHWNGIKHIFRYLNGSADYGLYYTCGASNLTGYADAGYLSDPHRAKSQTGYVFMNSGAAISWKSTKQTLVATSSNHAEILALHEASRECVWLRSLVKHIRGSCDLKTVTESPTILYEDNAACIAQIQAGFIKGDKVKHIAPKFFFTHELQKEHEIDVQKIQSCDNLADLFTKALPAHSFQKLRHSIGMRRLHHL